MDIRGITKVEAIVVVVIAIVVIGVDVGVFWFLGLKTHDLRTLSEVQQIRAGLESFNANTTYYPKSSEIVPLNDSLSNTEKLCRKGFERFSQSCEKVLLPFIPNSYAAKGERYLYRSVNEGQDYQIQFELLSNFLEAQIPKGLHCASSAGIVNQPCF